VMKRAVRAMKRAVRVMKRAVNAGRRPMEVGKRAAHDVGSARISFGRAFIASIRAGCAEGGDLRTRNAPVRVIDAAFLTSRSSPIDEKAEAFANTAPFLVLTARFTGRK